MASKCISLRSSWKLFADFCFPRRGKHTRSPVLSHHPGMCLCMCVCDKDHIFLYEEYGHNSCINHSFYSILHGLKGWEQDSVVAFGRCSTFLTFLLTRNNGQASARRITYIYINGFLICVLQLLKGCQSYIADFILRTSSRCEQPWDSLSKYIHQPSSVDLDPSSCMHLGTC